MPSRADRRRHRPPQTGLLPFEVAEPGRGVRPTPGVPVQKPSGVGPTSAALLESSGSGSAFGDSRGGVGTRFAVRGADSAAPGVVARASRRGGVGPRLGVVRDSPGVDPPALLRLAEGGFGSDGPPAGDASRSEAATDGRADLIRELRKKLGSPAAKADAPPCGRATGLSDALRLPAAGVLDVRAAGGEWDESARLLAAAVAGERAARTVWVDGRPPHAGAVAALGCDRVLWVHAHAEGETLWACEQALRCRSVGVVVASVGDADGTGFRRLKLAAEGGGGLLVLVRPAGASVPAWPDVRLTVRRAVSESASTWRPRLRVEVPYRRGSTEESSYEVTWNPSDDRVPVVSELAGAAAPAREAAGRPRPGLREALSKRRRLRA